jgi:hypothetical protein
MDEAIAVLKKSQKLLYGGTATLAFFFLVTFADILTGGLVKFANTFSIVFSLAFSLLLLILGSVQFRGVNRLLNAQNKSKQLSAAEGERYNNLLPDSNESGIAPLRQQTPVSVTEDTTIKLKVPDHSRPQ